MDKILLYITALFVSLVSLYYLVKGDDGEKSGVCVIIALFNIAASAIIVYMV